MGTSYHDRQNVNVEYNLTADGSAGPFTHSGGELHVQVVGNFGSGTLAVNADYGFGTTELKSLTAGSYERFDLRPGCELTFVLSGATSPDLNIVLR